MSVPQKNPYRELSKNDFLIINALFFTITAYLFFKTAYDLGWVVAVVWATLIYMLAKYKDKATRYKMLYFPELSRKKKKDLLVAEMTGKGYEVDKDGDSFIQFRKPKSNQVTWSFLFLALSVVLFFVLTPLGLVMLIIWFISLFLGKRNTFETILIPEDCK